MTPSLSALKEVCSRLEKSGLRFALGGSGLLYALGLVDSVRDWDLTTDAAFSGVSVTLEGLEWTRVLPSEQFKSDFLIQVKMKDTKIDIIGGFKVGDVRIEFLPEGSWQGIPLASAAEWLKAYELMGRAESAALIKAYLAK